MLPKENSEKLQECRKYLEIGTEKRKNINIVLRHESNLFK